MTLSQAPMLFLEAPTVSARRAARIRIQWFDYAFFTLALVGICGGALFLLELASSQNNGQDSIITRFMNEAATWLPVVSQKLMTYTTLFFAGVVNSAVIVITVQVLRNLDRMISRSRQRRWPASRQNSARHHTTPVSSPRRQPVQALKTNSFLLSPIIG